MRPRASLVLFVISLLLTLAACSKPNNEQAANTANNTENNPANANEANAPSGSERGGQKKPAARQAVVVPAGTTITVRLNEAVGSKISSPGQSFGATVATPVTVQGVTVIPNGVAATGTVVDAKPLGRFKGGAVLQIKLSSVTINGTEQQVQTSALSRSIQGKGKRTAVLTGGGAAAGALIGGLIGGGKGAAIGAVSGAGAGGAGSAFTGNKDIVLPAESAVSFKLEQALEVK
jgi:hypothetical protein